MAASGFDASQVAAIIKLDGSSYMFPVASFIYPVFVNLDQFEATGIASLPTNRTEFFEAAKMLTDESKNRYGWVLPLSLQTRTASRTTSCRGCGHRARA